MKIKLGQKARDRVTGFEGTVTARVEFLNGCVRYEVQPAVDKDGKHVESRYVDEPQIEVLAPTYREAVAATGGPRPDPVRSAAPTRGPNPIR